MPSKTKPKLAVWKFASCDGCQLSLLDCEDELLAITQEIEIANFPEASRAVVHFLIEETLSGLKVAAEVKRVLQGEP